MSELEHQERPEIDAVLSEDRARAVLSRAVQLQAESAQAIDDEARLAAPGEPGAAGFSVLDIVAAAAEVGIAPEFVDLALLEVRGEAGAAAAAKPVPPWLDRGTTLLLGSDRRGLVASRVIDAPPSDVFEAMQRIFPPMMALKNVVGDPSGTSGILSFDVVPGSSPFSGEMFLADIKRLDVALHPVPGGLDRSRVVVTARLDHSRKLNRWIGSGVSAFAVAAGGGTAASISGGVLGLAGAGAILPIAVGAGLAGSLGLAGFRWLYRWGLGRGAKGIDDLLGILDVHMRTGGAFASPSERPPSPSPPPFIPPPVGS